MAGRCSSESGASAGGVPASARPAQAAGPAATDVTTLAPAASPAPGEPAHRAPAKASPRSA